MAGALPRGIGFDVAGTVDAVGENVADVKPGDLVAGTADVPGQPSGGAADVAILRLWTPIPPALDPVDAAVLPMVTQTAVWTLDALMVGPDTTIVIHGAGGMVGFAAVQVAQRLGAKVIATAGPTFTADLEGFGALVTTYGDGMVERVRDLAGGRIDLVLDAAPSTPGAIETLVQLVDDPAAVVTISNHDQARAAGARVNLDLLLAGGSFPPDPLPEWIQLAANGEYRIPVARTFPLADWRDAVALSQSKAPHGKVVLLP
jgi:NADPH:quinone reductase-like Zn-dependent oxidoreductase